MSNAINIQTEQKPSCVVCGSAGAPLYSGLTDKMFPSGQDDEPQWSMLACAKCSSAWLSPRPIASELSKLYEGEDYYTHATQDFNISMPILGKYQSYLSAGFLKQKYGYGTSVSAVQRILGYISGVRFNWAAWESFKVVHTKAPQQGTRLLEVGCGSGVVLQNLSNRGWRAVGCDIDGVAVEFCASKGLNVVQGSVEELDFEDEAFDTVVSTHVIEHVDDPVLFMRECFRLTKTGGQLRIITPNVKSLDHRVFGRRWFHLDTPRHLCLFSADSLRQLAEQAGFKDIQVGSSLRDDNNSFSASLAYLLADREGGGAKLNNKLSRLLGKKYQLVEWILMLFSSKLGGELVLKATR